MGDDEVELDRDRIIEDDPDPARGQTHSLAEPPERAASGKADDAVRAEGRRADDVDHGPPRDERSTGGRYGVIRGHAAGILPR